MDAVIIYQLLGFLGFGAVCLAFLFACPKANLLMLAAGGILWGAHHLALGQIAYIVAFLSAGRNILGSFVSPKYILPIVAFYIPLIWVLTFNSLDNAYDVFPAFASSLGAVTLLFRESPLLYRSICLVCEVTWLAYGVFVFSYALIFAASIITCSIAIAIIRFDSPAIRRFFSSRRICSNHFKQATYQAAA